MPAPKKNTPIVDIPQPLVVKMEAVDAPEKHLPGWAITITAVIILILIVSIFLWTQFIISDATAGGSDTVKVTALLDIPKYTSLRDTLPVTVTLHNDTDQTLDLLLTLKAEPQDMVTLSQNGKDVVHVEKLLPGGTFTQTFTYLPLYKPEDGTFTFKIVLDDQQENGFHEEITSGEWTSKVLVNINHLRSIANYLLTGGLLSTVFTLFSDRLKKALGFS